MHLVAADQQCAKKRKYCIKEKEGETKTKE